MIDRSNPSPHTASGTVSNSSDTVEQFFSRDSAMRVALEASARRRTAAACTTSSSPRILVRSSMRSALSTTAAAARSLPRSAARTACHAASRARFASAKSVTSSAAKAGSATSLEAASRTSTSSTAASAWKDAKKRGGRLAPTRSGLRSIRVPPSVLGLAFCTRARTLDSRSQDPPTCERCEHSTPACCVGQVWGFPSYQRTSSPVMAGMYVPGDSLLGHQTR